MNAVAERLPRGTRELHAAAYRRRCGLIGVLHCCVCLWPDEIEPTSSGHHEACPAHAMLSKENP